MKQTVGGIIFLMLTAAVALISCRLAGIRTAMLRVAGIVVGFLLPWIPVTLWLLHHDLWSAFIDNAFLTGPKAKGSFWHVFLRPFIGIRQDPSYYLPPIAAVVFVALTLQPFRGLLDRLRGAVLGLNWKGPVPLDMLFLGAIPVGLILCVLFSEWLTLPGFVYGLIIFGLILYALFPEKFKAWWDRTTESGINWHSPLVAAALLLLLIVVCWFWPVLGISTRSAIWSAAALGTFGCLLLIVSSLPGVLRRDADLPRALIFYAYCLSFACGYAMALSWPIDEYMAFPALGVVIAAVSARRPDLARPLHRRWTVGIVAVVVVAAVFQKANIPSFWAGWTEPPPWSAYTTSKLPQLDGFLLSEDTARFYDDVTDLIRSHSQPDEAILVYPHMPVFYALSERRPATRAAMHIFDVCPDSLALADADRIRDKPPAVIVAMVFPEKYIEFNERAFRDGQPSGQRVLWATIEELVQNYDEVGTFEASGSKWKIRVWSRRR